MAEYKLYKISGTKEVGYRLREYPAEVIKQVNGIVSFTKPFWADYISERKLSADEILNDEKDVFPVKVYAAVMDNYEDNVDNWFSISDEPKSSPSNCYEENGVLVTDPYEADKETVKVLFWLIIVTLIAGYFIYHFIFDLLF